MNVERVTQIHTLQQRTQKRTGFVIPFVVDILVTELPKYLTQSANRLAQTQNNQCYLLWRQVAIFKTLFSTTI